MGNDAEIASLRGERFHGQIAELAREQGVVLVIEVVFIERFGEILPQLVVVTGQQSRLFGQLNDLQLQRVSLSLGALIEGIVCNQGYAECRWLITGFADLNIRIQHHLPHLA